MSQWFQRHGWASVHPDLLVGAGLFDANDAAAVAAEGVTAVLNLMEESEYPAGSRLEVEIALDAYGIEERRIAITDFGGLGADHLEAAVSLLAGWLDTGERVYLHCRAGWQRSATVAAALIVLREDRPPEQALQVLAERKPTASPLPHQVRDLLSWWEQRRPRP
ncbi:dual specificity protein phosphatase family protein [Conexibacter sp. DBS9H8]|uniref:protein-tyrosine phosphatase family protein n=1 Tax=Conexibacter sp. DBS9H8 TaxID=2937801 RepID=UPI00200EE3F3|nr:dual specificity protein phosphatase family protein [Conexibacter sp. DBS9H8]